MTVRDASLALAFSALLFTAACGTMASPDPQNAQSAAPQQPAPDHPAPPAFIEAACGGCHAVEPPFLSPNAAAPTFEAIANREGVNHKTLKPWLTDAHNYPEMMDFDLDPEQVDQVARYMITLQRDDYVPQP